MEGQPGIHSTPGWKATPERLWDTAWGVGGNLLAAAIGYLLGQATGLIDGPRALTAVAVSITFAGAVLLLLRQLVILLVVTALAGFLASIAALFK